MEAEELTEFFLHLYDFAEELAKEEGKSHREAFKLTLDYIFLSIDIEGKKKELLDLDKEIKELKSTAVILTAIKQRKMGKG